MARSDPRFEVPDDTPGLRLYLDAWTVADLELLSIKVEMELRRRYDGK